MFIIASEQTRELDRLAKILGQTWPALPVFVTNLETDLTNRQRVLRPFLPKRPSIKNWKTFIFQ